MLKSYGFFYNTILKKESAILFCSKKVDAVPKIEKIGILTSAEIFSSCYNENFVRVKLFSDRWAMCRFPSSIYHDQPSFSLDGSTIFTHEKAFERNLILLII